MKYAVMGDIHGNWEALCAVLKDAEEQGATHYACVGDIVGYNASPGECLDRVHQINCAVVLGNHDHYCVHDESLWDFHPLAANVVDWTRRHLTDAQKNFLRSCRMVKIVDGFTIVHSTLDMPGRWGYVFEEIDASANFNYQSTSVCFHGHTHIPAVFEKHNHVRRHQPETVKIALGTKYFINVGSVGQPRDGDPRAAYVVYDVTKKEVGFRRVTYDLAGAQKRIIDAGLPAMLARRLEAGK